MLVDDKSGVVCVSWSEAMQQGNWFFRISRKFGAIGKALKSLQRRRVFVHLSPDFGFMVISTSEPNSKYGDIINIDGRGNGNSAKPKKLEMIALDVRRVVFTLLCCLLLNSTFDEIMNGDDLLEGLIDVIY